MKQHFRSHNCGSLTKTNVSENVTLCGWVSNTRVTKSLIFIDLRDMYGITQLIITRKHSEFMKLKTIKTETILQVKGKVTLRTTANSKLNTGAIEVIISESQIINHANDLPFTISDQTTALEDLRLKYRYLDLRRTSMQNNLIFKQKVLAIFRQFLTKNSFVEIDTPCLTKSTPEGARDFLVPSRNKTNCFYALPQSPQIYKQLLMASGIDRYYQIAKCFRDEDFRSDRQPEFQQLDLEMAFVNHLDVISFVEKLIKNLWLKLKLPAINKKLARLTYQDAINLYGSDKPDLRCSCTIITFSKQNGLFLRGFWVADNYSADLGKQVLRIVEQHQAKNLIIFSKSLNKIVFNNSNITINNQNLKAVVQSAISQTAELCFLTYENSVNGAIALGAIRSFYCSDKEKQKMHQDFIININNYSLLWIINWPMFEVVNNKFVACHHPFTNPLDPEAFLNANKDKILQQKAAAYDLVLNGHEIGGGSMRIFNLAVQKKVFDLLALDKNAANEQFGFFLDAFNYGFPPHAGIAIGLDRLIMVLANNKTIRDTIAFPKNNSGVCLLTNSPSTVNKQQLNELSLKILNAKK